MINYYDIFNYFYFEKIISLCLLIYFFCFCLNIFNFYAYNLINVFSNLYFLYNNPLGIETTILKVDKLLNLNKNNNYMDMNNNNEVKEIFGFQKNDQKLNKSKHDFSREFSNFNLGKYTLNFKLKQVLINLDLFNTNLLDYKIEIRKDNSKILNLINFDNNLFLEKHSKFIPNFCSFCIKHQVPNSFFINKLLIYRSEVLLPFKI